MDAFVSNSPVPISTLAKDRYRGAMNFSAVPLEIVLDNGWEEDY